MKTVLITAVFILATSASYLALEHRKVRHASDRQAVIDAFHLVENELETYKQYLGDPVGITEAARIYKEQATNIPSGAIQVLPEEQQYKTHLEKLPPVGVQEMQPGLRYQDHLADLSGERVDNDPDNNAYSEQLGGGPTPYSSPEDPSEGQE